MGEGPFKKLKKLLTKKRRRRISFKLHKLWHQKLSILKIAENIGCKVNLILDGIYGLIFNPTYNPQYLKDKGLLF